MQQKTPLVFDEYSQQHRPMQVGETLTVASVPVSAVSGNMLQALSDGLAVVSSTPSPTPEAPVISPSDENYLRYASDGGLFVGGNDVLSNGDDNLLRIDGTDKKIKLTSADVQAAAGSVRVVSADTGNVVTAGSDNGAYLSANGLAASLVSPASPNGLVVDSSGKLYVNPVPTVTPASLLSEQQGNTLTLGSDDKLYVAKPSPSAFVNPTDKILQVTGDTLASVLGATYDVTTGHLTLTGVNDQPVAQVTIQTQGSVLESVSVVTDPPGQPAGTYLAMTFRKNDGTLETVYADLSAVGDVYTAGSGIDITNRVISARLVANGGLEVTAQGLRVNGASAALVSSDSGNMITRGSDGLLYAPSDCGVIE